MDPLSGWVGVVLNVQADHLGLRGIARVTGRQIRWIRGDFTSPAKNPWRADGNHGPFLRLAGGAPESRQRYFGDA